MDLGRSSHSFIGHFQLIAHLGPAARDQLFLNWTYDKEFSTMGPMSDTNGKVHLFLYMGNFWLMIADLGPGTTFFFSLDIRYGITWTMLTIIMTLRQWVRLQYPFIVPYEVQYNPNNTVIGLFSISAMGPTSDTMDSMKVQLIFLYWTGLIDRASRAAELAGLAELRAIQPSQPIHPIHLSHPSYQAGPAQRAEQSVRLVIYMSIVYKNIIVTDI